jgi:hypothetical protein
MTSRIATTSPASPTKPSQCSIANPVTLKPNTPEPATPPTHYPHLKSINLGLCSWYGSAELALNPIWSVVLAAKQPCVFRMTSTSSAPSAPAAGEGPAPANGEGDRSEFHIGSAQSVSLEARRYFDVDSSSRRGFASVRIGTSKNLGVALGLNFSDKHKDHSGLSVHVGAYANLARPSAIQPTFGVAFAWSSF